MFISKNNENKSQEGADTLYIFTRNIKKILKYESLRFIGGWGTHQGLYKIFMKYIAFKMYQLRIYVCM